MFGYFLSRSSKQAAAAGGVFMAAAILSYFAYGAYGADDRIQADDEAGILTHTLAEQLSIAVGAGVLGSALGFLAQKRPSVLLILILAIGAELVRRGPLSRENDISTGENALFIAAGIGIVVYVGVVSIRRRA